MPSDPIFSPQAFDLFEGIRRNPTAQYYHDHRDQFKSLIERPFQGMLRRAGLRLPGMMHLMLETEKNLFGRFLKNDFGQGGAWSSYWGAFYPRDSRRIADVQLAVWMNHDLLQISFYIGDYGPVPRARFRENCARYGLEVMELLPELITHPRIVLEQDNMPQSWESWFAAPDKADYIARLPLEPDEVCGMPGEQLETLIADTHSLYFPLALLSMEIDPLPVIRRYLGKS